MSVGRMLCKQLIDVAEGLRDYATLVEQFAQTPETGILSGEARDFARKLEYLIPRVLAFEGESLPMLTAGGPA